MLNVDLSIRDFDGQAVVALRGELTLADTPGVASHLIAAVAAGGPSVIVDLAGLEGIGYSGRPGGCQGAECAGRIIVRAGPALGGAGRDRTWADPRRRVRRENW